MLLAVAAFIVLTASSARASDSAADAAGSYVVETAGTTTALRVGEKGMLVLEIRPIPGVHVQRQAPVHVELSSSSGLELEKERLDGEHLAHGSEEAPRFEVPFVARVAGRQEVAATVEFFVCTNRWCVRQKRSTTLRIEVR